MPKTRYDDDDEYRDEEEYDRDFDGSELRFADPGGNSALRAKHSVMTYNGQYPLWSQGVSYVVFGALFFLIIVLYIAPVITWRTWSN